jgi:NADPH-dependent F420 reductase
MKIAIVGGTGKEGQGMAARWARAGHAVYIGSRDAERARVAAAELAGKAGLDSGAPVFGGADGSAPALRGGADDSAPALRGGDNAWVVQQAEVVVLSVPYAAHAETLRSLKAELAGKILVDITVPLKPPDVRRVNLPDGKAAALEAQALLGPATKVVAALHHVSAVHLAALDHALECDALACSDDPEALKVVLALIESLGTRALDAGPLANAVALESLTPVLLQLNRKYKSPGVGIRFTGL